MKKTEAIKKIEEAIESYERIQAHCDEKGYNLSYIRSGGFISGLMFALEVLNEETLMDQLGALQQESKERSALETNCYYEGEANGIAMAMKAVKEYMDGEDE